MGEKCVDYEVEGVRPTGRPKKTCSDVIKKFVRPHKYARKMLWTAGNGER